MWAYALIATGFLNWDYQRDSKNATLNSLLVIIPGIVLLTTTFIKPLATKLDSHFARYFWGIIGSVALIYAFLN